MPRKPSAVHDIPTDGVRQEGNFLKGESEERMRSSDLCMHTAASFGRSRRGAGLPEKVQGRPSASAGSYMVHLSLWDPNRMNTMPNAERTSMFGRASARPYPNEITL